MKKPMEFWIQQDQKDIQTYEFFACDVEQYDTDIHVIEYAAYEKLQKERLETVENLTSMVIKLGAEIAELKKSGYMGACYLCEPIGEENKKLKKILAKEFNENDEFGEEYLGITMVREENKKLREALEYYAKNEGLRINHQTNMFESCDSFDNKDFHGATARKALEKE